MTETTGATGAKRARSPKDLGARGRSFWTSTVSVFELNESETRLLHECCRILDELDELREVVVREGVSSTGSTGQTVAHPALAAMSSHRGLLGRLLTQLDLPYEDDVARTPSQIRASRAASSRWERRAAVVAHG
jgi:hypothetical protein